MTIAHRLLLTASILSVLSCTERADNFVIGVSQCSEDSWRKKLKEELEMATYFNEGVTLLFTSANDDSQLQQRQIDSLAASGIDLLIVSPNQYDLMSAEIDKVYDAGIPVIMYDRKTNSSKYTSFVRADNFQIGEMIGHCLAEKIGGRGNVVEIGGLKESSPAQERHEGFVQAIGQYPGIRIVGFEYGTWTEDSGKEAMNRILARYYGRIDAVFGGNDRMAVGARNAIREAGLDKDILYFGVDALPFPGKGICQVADSILTASAIYPTRGDELLLLALDILRGKEYSKDVIMQSSLVTEENAEILLLQYEEVVRQGNYLKTMFQQAGKMHDSIKLQQIIIGIILLSLIVIVILLSFYIKAFIQKKNLYENIQLEKEKVERQRDELEEQRDRLIELSIKGHNEEEENEQAGKDVRGDSAFIQKFTQIVEQKMSNPDLSVEDISSELFMSRVQLYRRVKAITGKSPVEIIRQMRLAKADKLLSETSLNISEVAYNVGFSSASYFAKCYRDYFNKLPRETHKL
ncbi:MAG: substrate-binding domain-containing protein [Bacteroidales bacterium]|nr:substrate-binding domain-containing protein [Bacteroidales bacterium]